MNEFYLKPAGLVSLFIISSLFSINAVANDRNCEPFTELSIVLEQNATDGDSEVVVFAKGQDIGLDHFVVRAPDGNKVAKFKGDKKGVGMREFLFESAEPPDLDKVLASFPEGTYLFDGRTVEGGCLHGSAFLSHTVAPETQILTPGENQTLNRSSVSVSWLPIENAAVYVVELKNEDTEYALLVEVAAPATSFDAPASWFVPDTEYQVAVTVVTASGNKISVETAFFTEAE